MQSNDTKAKLRRQKGRPRNEATKRAILDAALDLAIKRNYQNVTLLDVAAQARTSRQTIYRWWPSLSDLYVDVVEEQIQRISQTPVASGDLHAYLSDLFAFHGGKIGSIATALMLDSGSHPRVTDTFRPLLAMRLQRLAGVIDRFAAERGSELAVSSIVVAETIAGAMWYRSLHQTAPLDDAFAAELTAMVVALLKQKNSCMLTLHNVS